MKSKTGESEMNKKIWKFLNRIFVFWFDVRRTLCVELDLNMLVLKVFFTTSLISLIYYYYFFNNFIAILHRHVYSPEYCGALFSLNARSPSNLSLVGITC